MIVINIKFLEEKSTENERVGVKNKVQRCLQNRTTKTSSLVTSHLFPLSFCCYHKQNSLHPTLSSHFISFTQPTRNLFLCIQGWLLNLHKHPLALVNLWNQMNQNLCLLFCLHIEHATCLFEWRRLIGSPEVAGCSFCFLISLHSSVIWWSHR